MPSPFTRETQRPGDFIGVVELEREDIRQLPYPPYRIIYRVEPKRVVILTVRHGRRAFDEAEVASE